MRSPERWAEIWLGRVFGWGEDNPGMSREGKLILATLAQVIGEAVAEEREACARYVDECASASRFHSVLINENGLREIAAALRARA